MRPPRRSRWMSFEGNLLRRLAPYFRPHLLRILLTTILLLAGSGLELAGPYLTMLAIDEHVMKSEFAGLGTLCLLYLAAQVGAAGCRFLQQLLLNWTGQQVMHRLRVDIMTHLQRLSASFYDRFPVGKLMTRLTSDVEALNELFTAGLVTVAGDLVTIAGIMGMMLWIDQRLALVSFAILPLLVAIVGLFRRRVRVSFQRVRANLSELNGFLQEVLSGMGTVQAFNQEEATFRTYDRRNSAYRDAYLQTIFYYALFYPAIRLVEALGVALVLWKGAGWVVEDAVTLGTLVAFMRYLERFWRPLRDLAEKYNIFQAALTGAERIFDLLDRDDYDGGSARMADRLLAAAPATGAAASPRHRRPRGAHIVFDRVSFAYRGEEAVLREVSFEVGRGETLALVGATGSGKTTLTRLLLRLYEVEPGRGRILVDGEDIRTLDPAELRGRIGTVLQDDLLFHGTIKENIRLWDRRFADEDVREAARLVGADAFIERLPEGYETPLGERGANLSVGERQLLTFARCILRNPDILILDEATSAVDSQTEALIQRALEGVTGGRTALIVAHRLTSAQRADKIVVLHHGRVVESGSHEVLIARKGIYARLYELQRLEGR